MTTIVTTDENSGQLTDAPRHNNNFTAVKTVVNGNIDNNNISASAGIAASKLASYPADALKVLKGDGTWDIPPLAWTAYTPSWDANSPGVGLGNVVKNGVWATLSDTVIFTYFLQIGSTTTCGGGEFFFGLPTISSDNTFFADFSRGDVFGNGYILDSSANDLWEVEIIGNGIAANTFNARLTRVATYTVGATIPFTWAVGDIFACQAIYPRKTSA
jgi:hypothetical protein